MTYSAFKDKENSPKNKGMTHNKNNNKREIKPPKKITEKYLHNAGLAYLERFPASARHFKTVMMRKINRSCRHHVDQEIDQCENMLNALIVKFQDWGLIDDTAYLKGMVTSLRRRGLAARHIEMKLAQKGLQKEDITKAVQNYDEEELPENENGDFYAALIFARKKRLGPYDIVKRHTPEKTLSTFARAGYSYDIIKKITNLTQEECEQINP